tara:strand:- start:265 stop:1119 length:855 start_codon:yes stop_codon:yes gene_type:complete
MAGYIGSKAVNLSTTGADIAGDADVSGALDVGGAFTSQGIDDNATSTAMTLDASGNVGIGTSSVDYSAAGRTVLQAEGSSNALVNITDGTSNFYLHQKGGTSGVDLINTANSYMRFATNNSEAMRIDAAGRVTTPYQPAFKAYLQADVAMTNSGYYKVTHGGSQFNIGGHYSTSNTRFTAPVAGAYFFYAHAILEGFGTSQTFRMTSQIRVNGNSGTKNGLSSGGSANSVHDDNEVQVSGLIYLNANDYVEHYVSTSGATDTTGNIWGQSTSMPWTSFGGYLIG